MHVRHGRTRNRYTLDAESGAIDELIAALEHAKRIATSLPHTEQYPNQ